MTFILVTGWVGVLAASRTQALGILAGITTLFYGGKEAGLPLGIAAGANPLLLGAFIFLADAAATCFVYPPLHYAIRNWLERDGLVGEYLRFLRAAAVKRQALVTRFGAFGLFLFMLIPFAINGPLVGALLGRLMGLRARQIVPTLMVAIGVTTVVWTGIYAFGLQMASTIDPILPKVIAAIVVLVVVAHGLVSFLHVRRNRRRPATPALDGPPQTRAAADARPELLALD